jgi:DNA-binding transcriptional ArsR family regulator
MTDIQPVDNTRDPVSFVISSSYRVAVLDRLADGPATSTHIASDTEVRIPYVSRALGRLRERSFVELLVADNRRQRRLTALPIKVLY